VPNHEHRNTFKNVDVEYSAIYFLNHLSSSSSFNAENIQHGGFLTLTPSTRLVLNGIPPPHSFDPTRSLEWVLDEGGTITTDVVRSERQPHDAFSLTRLSLTVSVLQLSMRQHCISFRCVVQLK
jgi:hypothetical protein